MTHTIHNMDCLSWMKQQPDNTIDMILTSPPYDSLRDYNGYTFDYEQTISELYRITKDGGVCVWNVNDTVKNGSESCTSFKQALYAVSCGWRLHDTMIYAKNNPQPNNPNSRRYQQCFEYLFVFSKGDPKTFNPIMVPTSTAGATNTSAYRKKDGNRVVVKKEYRVADTRKHHNIFYYTVGKGGSTKDSEAFGHPALMPEKLAEDMILSWSNQNDIVYDPFSGSGTTGKMAVKNNRHYIGTEVSSEYCQLAQNRIKPYANPLFTIES